MFLGSVFSAESDGPIMAGCYNSASSDLIIFAHTADVRRYPYRNETDQGTASFPARPPCRHITKAVLNGLSMIRH
jgi:hypothetical protein